MSLLVALALLTLALGSAFPLFAWYAMNKFGNPGLLAAAVAFGVCWFGSAAALLVVAVVRSSPAAGLLGSIFFRMGFPLLTGFYLQSQHGSLAQAGVFGMIVAYYLLALVVETLLSLRVASVSTKSTKAV